MKNQYAKKIGILLLIICLTFTAPAFASTDVVKRPQAAEKYKWDLTDLYPDRTAFEKELTEFENDILPLISNYKGELNSVDNIVALLKLDEEASRTLSKAYFYSRLKLDLNQADPEAQEMASKTELMSNKYGVAKAYITPELMALDEGKLGSIMNDPKLKVYQLIFEKKLRQKEHILSEREEKILSLAGDMADSPKDIFNKLLYADYEPPTITGENGEEIKLTDGVYYKILRGSDRDLRKRAFEARGKSIEKVNNTLAGTYIANIKKDIFFAKARKYQSALQATLEGEFVSEEIYHNLLDATNDNLEYRHDFIELRKKALGYDEYHAYDDNAHIVDNYSLDIPYDEAVQIVKEALQPLGEEYIAHFEKGISERWIDVYEDDNKITGAYCGSIYDSHPYILLNYDNSLLSLLTLAHEMGHALNDVYIHENQEYENSGTYIFTAEVASTANEMLVMNYLIKNAKSDQEKLYLLSEQIERINGNLYNQVMFSEFEKKAHELAEDGTPLTAQVLNEIYLDLVTKYSGNALTVDELTKVNWSKIPHFYDSFYVYKYATSTSAAFALVNNIISGEEGAVENYLNFLSSGTSDYPVEILKKAGVDMNSPQTVRTLLQYYGQLVDEMESILDKQAGEKSAQEAKSITYMIKKGDVLWKVAEKYKTTWQELAEINDLNDPNLLIPGSELVIRSN